MAIDRSSYSNPVEPITLEDDEVIVSTTDRFRRNPIAPALESSRDEVGKCDHERGHVLQVLEGKVKCIHCPAEWRDEGF